MPVTVVATRRAQFERAVEIATVLFASEFDWLVEAFGLSACVSPSCRIGCAFRPKGQCPHHVAMDLPLPERLRAVLERLGPTFVKAGQMLALRPDYVPLEYAEALRSLHDDVAPFPGDQARMLVEDELGRPLEEVYAEFEHEPFAAASLSQVHRAILPDGRAVAVKIQRPGIAELVERDLALLAYLARRLERRRPGALSFRPSEAVAEFADYTRRELDFRLEARTAERVLHLLVDEADVVIPAIDWERSSQRVLTMELLEGASPAPADQLRAKGLDPEALLRTGARAMLHQIFVHGLFHADPHPGNVLFLSGNRIAFLDFGMFGRLDRRTRSRMGILFWALVSGDYEAVGEQLLRMSALRPGSDQNAFRSAIAEAAEEWFSTRPDEFSIAQLLLRELSLGAGCGVVFPRELMLVARSLVNLESTAAVVDPAVSLAELSRPFLPELRKTLIPGPGTLEEAWRDNRFQYIELAVDLPDLLLELAERLGEVHTPGGSPSQPRTARRWLVGSFLVGALATGFVRRRR